jgi:hypothetical protein
MRIQFWIYSSSACNMLNILHFYFRPRLNPLIQGLNRLHFCFYMSAHRHFSLASYPLLDFANKELQKKTEAWRQRRGLALSCLLPVSFSPWEWL